MNAEQMWRENETGIELIKAPPRKKRETEKTQDIGPLCVFPPDKKPTSETVQHNNDDTVLAMIRRIAKDDTLDMPTKVAKLRESVPFAVEHPVVTLFHLFSGAKKGGMSGG